MKSLYSSVLLSVATVVAVGCLQPKKASVKSVESGTAASGGNPEAYESQMSAESKALRDSLLKITKKEEIDPLLDKLEKDYATLPPDAQYVAAQLLALKPMKSIVWRLSGLFESSRVTHSAVLQMVMATAVGIRNYLPTDQWEAGFNYLTEPFPETKEKFNSIQAYQQYLLNDVYPVAQKSLGRLKGIAIDASKPMVFDNKIAYGTASLKDDLDRFEYVGEPERNATVAAGHAGIHNLLVFCAYNQDHLIEISQKLGKIMGFDGFPSIIDRATGEFFDTELDGVPSVKRSFLLKNNRYARDFTISSEGPKILAAAFDNLKSSVKYTRDTFESVKGRPANDFQVLNASKILPFNRINEMTLKNMEALVSGPTSVKSAVTGEVVSIDLPKVYSIPPQDLKIFLPNEWDKTKFKKILGLDVRNYQFGAPTAFNDSAYNVYVRLEKKADAPAGGTPESQIVTISRVLSQSWGGGFVNLPIAVFVN